MTDDKEWLAKALADPTREARHFEAGEMYPLAGYTTGTISATAALTRLAVLPYNPQASEH
jgi:hypothetical protein